MIKRFLAGVAALCALAIASTAVAQVKVTAPAGTSVPSTAVTFGAKDGTATFVDPTHVLPAGRPDIAASGTIAAGTPNAAYTVAVDGSGVAGFKVAGLTAAGATLTLEGSYDGGTTWAAINGVSGGTGVLATTYTADGNFTVATGGRTGVRLRVSSTGSGTITVASNLSGVSTDIRMSSPLPPGANDLGSIHATGFRYQLLGTYGGSGASASGSAVGPVFPGAYTFACTGTIGGGVITLQVLGPDGATFQTVSGISFGSLPANAAVVMPAINGGAGSANVTAANARAVLTGASGASVFCSLS